MIVLLKGKIIKIDPTYIILDVSGVGYEVKISLRTYSEIKDLKEKLQHVKDYKGPILCNILIDNKQKIIPKLEFGNPLEDMSPYLTDEEIKSNMIIPMIPRRDNSQGWVTLK